MTRFGCELLCDAVAAVFFYIVLKIGTRVTYMQRGNLTNINWLFAGQ